MSYIEMCLAMQSRKTVTIKGFTGVINKIEAEDGSGGCWNVLINTVGGAETVFVRTR